MTTTHVHEPDHDRHTDQTWRLPLRRRWIISWLVALLPVIGGGLVVLTGWNLFWWTGPVLLLIVIPIADRLTGLDVVNVPDFAEESLAANPWYRYGTYAFIPTCLFSLTWCCWIWTTHDLSPASLLGLALTMGIVTGLGINAGHELGHKHPQIEQWAAKIAVAPSAYGHFFVEHNRGHHTWVSTPVDPASARLGQSFWEFLPRTVFGSLRSAINIERTRSARLGRSFWSPRNDLLNAWALTVVLFGALIAAFGPGIIPLLVIQAITGICMLEVVNYMEHYGLLREQRPDGRYQRCEPQHSWNAAHRTTNTVLFNLQRHSDHHANPTRRYQILRHFDDVPQLPTGYAGLIVVALVPAWWRHVMDHRVVEFYGGDITRANIHPRTRRRLLARYGTDAST